MCVKLFRKWFLSCPDLPLGLANMFQMQVRWDKETEEERDRKVFAVCVFSKYHRSRNDIPETCAGLCNDTDTQRVSLGIEYVGAKRDR
jgi:hypothetical protein